MNGTDIKAKVYEVTLLETIMASPLNQQSLGLLIKERRKTAALTQDVAAMLCGVTKKTLIRVEKGEDVYISTVFKILDGLGIDIVSVQTSDTETNGWY
ncbi:transcriptional regulator, XRE family [Shewanella sp. MR-4]|nr:transcriptional regulator, XRE family [Shewanella sp. MR-4]